MARMKRGAVTQNPRACQTGLSGRLWSAAGVFGDVNGSLLARDTS
jgi:hypothetical protein